MASGIFGLIIALVLFVIIFGPTLAVLIGIAAGIGAIIGGIQSGRKQAKSLEDSKKSGDPELLALDRLRIRVQVVNFLFLAFLVFSIAAVIACNILGSMGLIPKSAWVIAMLLLGGILAFLGFQISPGNKKYKSSFKEIIVRKGLETALDNVEYNPACKLDESVIRESGLFVDYSGYTGNDFIKAEKNGISFIQSDARLVKETSEYYIDSDGDRRSRVKVDKLFEGRFMVFDYDAISNEPVEVHPRKGSGSEINTELEAFNRKFAVIAKDAESAFRILTPQVLEGITLASDKLGCPMHLSFRNDKIYVAISNGDTFEAAAVGDSTLMELRKSVAEEIQAVIDMVGTLYLGANPKTYGLRKSRKFAR
jgi:hypothetical protein